MPLWLLWFITGMFVTTVAASNVQMNNTASVTPERSQLIEMTNNQ